MQLDDSGRVIGFREKPQTGDELEAVRTDPAWIEAQDIESRGWDYLASMGIYLFKRDVLVELLKTTDYEYFGKQVFPTSIAARHIQVHLFDGYWEDIGTSCAFYEANLALTSPNPPFEFAAEDAPIYSCTRSLTPVGIGAGSHLQGVIVDKNCRIGQNVRVQCESGTTADSERSPVVVCEGVVVVPKATTLSVGWSL